MGYICLEHEYMTLEGGRRVCVYCHRPPPMSPDALADLLARIDREQSLEEMWKSTPNSAPQNFRTRVRIPRKR